MTKIETLETSGLIDASRLTEEQRQAIESSLSEAELNALLEQGRTLAAHPEARIRSAKVGF